MMMMTNKTTTPDTEIPTLILIEPVLVSVSLSEKEKKYDQWSAIEKFDLDQQKSHLNDWLATFQAIFVTIFRIYFWNVEFIEEHLNLEV